MLSFTHTHTHRERIRPAAVATQNLFKYLKITNHCRYLPLLRPSLPPSRTLVFCWLRIPWPQSPSRAIFYTAFPSSVCIHFAHSHYPIERFSRHHYSLVSRDAPFVCEWNQNVPVTLSLRFAPPRLRNPPRSVHLLGCERVAIGSAMFEFGKIVSERVFLILSRIESFLILVNLTDISSRISTSNENGQSPMNHPQIRFGRF